ncbi:MAG: hypothetical protein IPK44_01610 [Candidatus Accumulibacter sp.]|uniref:hypothetical protein n=1 Tax=Accumulibacter sp. TaxID=2053492 RepID=UPI00258DDA3C|nr:hypothetical protein [Accumulibacter sp.]MBK8113297.1 hypothetical protein [Accumulibacter sp.]
MDKFGKGPVGQKGIVEKVRRAVTQAVDAWRPAATKKNLDQVTAGPYQVQGRKASDLEYRTYITLKKLGWREEQIRFQVAILGGRMPGGQMLDFVLQGPGLVYVIYVNGDYWHKFGLKLDITRQNEQVVSRVMPGAVVVSVFSNDLATDAIARVTLLKMVGRG